MILMESSVGPSEQFASFRSNSAEISESPATPVVESGAEPTPTHKVLEAPSNLTSTPMEPTVSVPVSYPVVENPAAQSTESMPTSQEQRSSFSVESVEEVSLKSETQNTSDAFNTEASATVEKPDPSLNNSSLFESTPLLGVLNQPAQAMLERRGGQESKERDLDAKEVLIRKGLDNNLELLPETSENKTERESYQQLVRFIEFVQKHPDKALEWPGESAQEVPAWIHAFFQESATPEQIAQRSPRDLQLNSTLFDIELSQDTLKKLFRTKNILRENVSSYTATATGAPERISATKFLHLLGKSITQQAFALHTLQKAQKNIAEYTPNLSLAIPVNIQVRENASFGGRYFGKLNDEHLLAFRHNKTPSLKQLGADDLQTEIATSVMEHELIHAMQSEIFAPKTNGEELSANPFINIPEFKQEFIKKMFPEKAEADDLMVYQEFENQGEAKDKSAQESIRLVLALLEGPTVIGQVALLNKKIENSPSEQIKQTFEAVKNSIMLEHRVGLEQNIVDRLQTLPQEKQNEIREMRTSIKEKQSRYREGRLLYQKLYKEFGVEQLPFLFSALDFSTITKLKATPELMQAYIEDPRLLPGLEKLPMIQESLKRNPPTVKPPEGEV